ncbi:MAG TPA: 3-deoxy-7-phosphoheptulonate synthase [bacterium]|nr:3-deoxy-7-phosphoheptulonate synthase [bacterium]
MIVVMKHDSTPEQIHRVTEKIEHLKCRVQPIHGEGRILLGLLGPVQSVDPGKLRLEPGVEDIVRVLSEPYKLAGRPFHPQKTEIHLKGVTIGGHGLAVMAGPCAVENEKQIHEIASLVRAAGARILRGGAFKPRTSPYSFQGLGEEGLRFLRQASDLNQMLAISEIMDTGHVELMYPWVDIFQIGARNMQNFTLLKAVGCTDKPVMLKRGMAATIEEWLMAAEYIMSQGNEQVILCERGIRTFETYTRNTLDISAIPVVTERSHLPVIADPSHGTGRRDKVAPMARAAVAAGADGLMIEVHNHPEEALSDGAQSLLPHQFLSLMEELQVIAWAIGRSLDE